MKQMRFKQGELTKESLNLILFDVNALIDSRTEKDRSYHYDLIVGNLKDIWGEE